MIEGHVALVGGGLMGASWAALFLSRGHAVKLYEADAAVAETVPQTVARLWPALARLDGLDAASPLAALTVVPTLGDAVRGAGFVQESVSERVDLKQEIFAEVDSLVPVDTIIASSTSGIRMSDIQARCVHPERCVTGHPMNPAHLMPLVEVCGGNATASAALDRAEAIYRSLGKDTIRLQIELPGHAINRLQAALARECVHLLISGALSAEDVDKAITAGPGIRLAKVGPLLNLHMAGGKHGIRGFMQQFAPFLAGSWKMLGNPDLTPEVQERLVDAIEARVGGRSIDALEAERDEWVINLLLAARGERA